MMMARASRVLGARNLAQFSSNIACLDVTLPAEHLTRLTAASTRDAGSPATFLRGAPGRDFMWGAAASVPGRPAVDAQPWWELVTLAETGGT